MQRATQGASSGADASRVRIDGKQFSLDNRRFRFRGVTYGTFRPRADGAAYPERPRVEQDFQAIAAAGFTVVRTYTTPPDDVIELAGRHGLRLLSDVFYPDWRYLLGHDRRSLRHLAEEAKAAVRAAARHLRGCETMLGLSLGNEVPADVLRWYGTGTIADLLTELAEIVREEDPGIPPPHRHRHRPPPHHHRPRRPPPHPPPRHHHPPPGCRAGRPPVAADSAGRVIVSGILFHTPVAGVIYQMLHYLIGLRELGHDPFYVEDTDWWSFDPRTGEVSPDPTRSLEVAVPVLERYGFGDRWAYRRAHAVDDPRGCWGLAEEQVLRLYREADALLNVTGSQWIWDELQTCPNRILVETDPLSTQIDAANGSGRTLAHLDAHHRHFTFGETLREATCPIPLGPYEWLPTRQPVALELWQTDRAPANRVLSTITSWHDEHKDRVWQGETYYWTKDREFRTVLDLPERRPGRFRLAVTDEVEPDREELLRKGWLLDRALAISADPRTYHRFITDSWAEFTVARDQYARGRSGWFSDRSACYLAAGRPVITQETGFSSVLPTGEGLFAWSTPEDVLAALDAIDGEPRRHQRAAADIAREHFAAPRVIGRLLEEAGVTCRYLRVCSRPAGDALNCGHCQKCLLTRLMLVALGRGDEFESFPSGHLDAELIANLRLFSRSDIQPYLPLAPLLEARGRGDLAEALHKLDEHFHTWDDWRELALADIARALPGRVPFLLADEGYLATPDQVLGHPRTELYQPAADNVGAALVSELKRQVSAGVHHLVVAWPASWWLDVYRELSSYLHTQQRLLLSTERVRVYELAGPVG